MSGSIVVRCLFIRSEEAPGNIGAALGTAITDG